jgi:hypothetical protein
MGCMVQGLNPSGGKIFRTHTGCTMDTRSFLGLKWLEHGTDHLPPSSAKVNERVELYLHSRCGRSWPVTGWTLPYLYLIVKNTHWLLLRCFTSNSFLVFLLQHVGSKIKSTLVQHRHVSCWFTYQTGAHLLHSFWKHKYLLISLSMNLQFCFSIVRTP